MKRLAVFICLAALFPAAGCHNPNKSRQLVIFHAGSLSLPMKALADSFRTIYPGTEFLPEASGSLDCARKITELGRSCDILASADYSVIDQLLIPGHASENIPFAGNRMAIVFTPQSRYASEITPENWYEILLRDDVFYGRSDPNADPCGYRTLLMLQLAQKHYRLPDGKAPFLLENFVKKDTRFIRPKEVDLLSLLESHAVDYIFLYRSLAQQHQLNFLELPGEINLGEEAFAGLYATASVRIRGSAPGDSIDIKGTPMIYSLTIPHNAENPRLAAKFVAFVLDSAGGQKILRSMGQ